MILFWYNVSVILVIITVVAKKLLLMYVVLGAFVFWTLICRV